MIRIIVSAACFLLILTSCNDAHDVSGNEQTPSGTENTQTKPDSYYQEIYRKIVTGQATLAEVKEALTDRDIAALTNTLHGLYAMRYHRGVIYLLSALWSGESSEYPELSWDLLDKTPTRLALASTLNRIYIGQTREYINFIREHKNETHEFHLAQVAIALGLNGDPSDVDYLKELASGDNIYVVQTALTALSLMNNPRARDALIYIEEKFSQDPRSNLATELLRQAYHWPEQPAG